MPTDAELLRNRFIWTPTDIRLVKRSKPDVKQEATGSGGKSEMPALHRQQLENDKQLSGR